MKVLTSIRSLFASKAPAAPAPLAQIEERAAPAGLTSAEWVNLLRMVQGVGGSVSVTPLRVLGVATVFACLKVLSETMSTLPIRVVKRTDNEASAVAHPLNVVLQLRGNAEMTARDVLAAGVINQALRGNGYLQVLRNGFGEVIELWPLPAGEVTIGRDAAGRLVYRCRGTTLSSDEVVHVRGLTFDGLIGADLPFTLRPVFELAIALQDHGTNFFVNGASLGGILEFPSDPSATDREEVRKQWNEKHAGVANAHKLMVLGGGVKFSQPKASQKDAEFEASRKAQDLQICQAFGIPPFKIGLAEGGPKSSAEQAQMEFVASSVRPLSVAWNQALSMRLLTAEELRAGYRVEYDLTGLLQGDATARQAYYKTMREMGVMNADEIRLNEGLPRIADGGGQAYWQPLNMTSAAELAAVKAARTTTAPAA